MRVSAVFALGLAGLAVGSPILAKKKLVYHYVTETVVVYVTPGAGDAQQTQQLTLTPGLNEFHQTEKFTFRASTPDAAPTPSLMTPLAPPVVPTSSAVVVPATQPSVVVVTVTPSPAAPASSPPATSAPAAPPASAAVASPAPNFVAPIGVAPPASIVAPPASSAAAPTSTVAAPLTAPTDYKSAVLYHHNIHRANNSADPLVFDDTLASYAALTAASCVFAHDLKPGNGGYGQNIADSGTNSPDEKNKDPVKLVGGVISNMWYTGEVSSYPAADYGKPTPDMSAFHDWGHYSQVVWKATKSVGCATHYCASGDGTMFSGGWSGWFTVCNYAPAGNVGGAYGVNVGRPLGQATFTV